MKIVACERRSGKFTPENQQNEIEFDNYIFTCITNDTEGLVFGKKYESVKVAKRDIDKFYPQGVQALADKDVIFERNNNGRVIGIYTLNSK